MGWKESLSITIAAQLAVAPILIGQFGNFTLTSFLSNILILFTVPVENDKVRYCMNSAALRFIKKEDLKEKGYGKYLTLFKKS